MSSVEQTRSKRLRWPRAVAAALILTGALAARPVRADTASGLEAFRLGQFSEAIRDWRQAAEGGDAAASLYLGVLYDTGFGVPQDQAQALFWYERGGERGNVTAMFNAAVMHDAGRGTGADPAAALAWYERAARAGSGRAEYDLGLLYENGTGVPRNRERAISYFRQAVAHGISAGRAHLSRLGASGFVAVGHAKADPAINEFEQAQRALLTRGPDADASAASLFRRAAEGGNALAAYNLGYCYEYGIGVPRDLDRALFWYRRSAAASRDPALRDIALGGERGLAKAKSQR